MTIEELGDARFASFEKALESALDEAVERAARVRRLFKVSKVGTLEPVVAESSGDDDDLNPAQVVKPTAYVRGTTSEIPFGSGASELGTLGTTFVTMTLFAEDRALIDALDDSYPEPARLTGDWIDAACGPIGQGGPVEDRQNRVLLACEKLPPEQETLIRERGVRIFYPDPLISTYCRDKPRGAGTAAAKGYLLLEPNPDSVKLKIASDWQLFRSTRDTGVKLTVTSSWVVAIEPGAVIRISE